VAKTAALIEGKIMEKDYDYFQGCHKGYTSALNDLRRFLRYADILGHEVDAQLIENVIKMLESGVE
jgi:GGDEF domain-containing protein